MASSVLTWNRAVSRALNYPTPDIFIEIAFRKRSRSGRPFADGLEDAACIEKRAPDS